MIAGMKQHIVQFVYCYDDNYYGCRECPPSAKPDEEQDNGYRNQSRQPPLTNRRFLPGGLFRCVWLRIFFSCALQVSIPPARQQWEEQRGDQSAVAANNSFLMLPASLLAQNQAITLALHNIRYTLFATTGSC